MNRLKNVVLIDQSSYQKIGHIAQWALEEEVLLTPKPGLVDRDNTGSHNDLTVDLMLISAKKLNPFFTKMATVSSQLPTLTMIRESIGQIGRDAEVSMMKATGNINTHRGAIWALGLLSAAVSQQNGNASAEELCQIAGKIAQISDTKAPVAFSKGKAACQKYKVNGAQKEAQQGFPNIVNLALPTLRSSRLNGDTESAARLNALMALMTEISDTCVLSRSGLEGQHYMQQQAQIVLDLGGAGSTQGFNALLEFGKKMESLNASPGGAADLLAATLFVDALESDGIE